MIPPLNTPPADDREDDLREAILVEASIMSLAPLFAGELGLADVRVLPCGMVGG